MVNSNQTLPKLLAERASKYGSDVALRQKQYGIWNEITWQEYYDNVERFAIALEKKLDLVKDEKVVLIGENRPQWLIAQLAVQVVGGISVGVYQESSPEQLEYYLQDTQARIVVAEDQEQVDKLFDIQDKIPSLQHIVFYNDQGMKHYKDEKLVNYGTLLNEGENLLKQEKDFFTRKTEQALGNDIAIIAYSAATSGNPKGAMLTHTNIISAAKSLEKIDSVGPEDDYLSFLPLAWIHEQVLSITFPLIKGMVINFPERPSTVMTDLREIGPHTMLAPGRVYQTLMSNMNARLEGAPWFKRTVYNYFSNIGKKIARNKLNGGEVSGFDKMMFKIGDFLVFSAVRDHYGLVRTKRAYVAGSSLSDEVFYFFHSIGVNLKQTYGGTELSGMAFVQHDDDIQLGTSGKPLPNTEVKLNDENEVFVKNPAVFAHYLNDEDEHQVSDGWLSLGDYGEINKDGHLVILERKENVLKLNDNKIIYPTPIENRVKVSPYIQEAICFGDERDYVAAFLNIDIATVGRWADQKQIVYTSYSDLATNEDVIELIQKEIQKINVDFKPEERIKRFIILHSQFNANNGELTRTLKVRRKFIKEKYADVIDQMYNGNDFVTYKYGIQDSLSSAKSEEVKLAVVEVGRTSGSVKRAAERGA